MPHTVAQVAPCTQLGSAIDVTELSICMTIFWQLGVKCFEERVCPFADFLKSALWAGSDPAEKPFLIRFSTPRTCFRRTPNPPLPPAITPSSLYCNYLFTGLYSYWVISFVRAEAVSCSTRDPRLRMVLGPSTGSMVFAE